MKGIIALFKYLEGFPMVKICSCSLQNTDKGIMGINSKVTDSDWILEKTFLKSKNSSQVKPLIQRDGHLPFIRQVQAEDRQSSLICFNLNSHTRQRIGLDGPMKIPRIINQVFVLILLFFLPIFLIFCFNLNLLFSFNLQLWTMLKCYHWRTE